MARHNDLGEEGEIIAQHFIEKKGFKILDCNWRYLQYEVDIIARDEKKIIFIEVKTRSTYRYGFPDESVTPKKEKTLVEAAEIYLEQKNYSSEVRFDVISVVKNETEEKIYHIEDAFQG
tara:strand:- start:301 stop:657 length:357 start_codon:yes stop_codon:yes gene_type:complete